MSYPVESRVEPIESQAQLLSMERVEGTFAMQTRKINLYSHCAYLYKEDVTSYLSATQQRKKENKPVGLRPNCHKRETGWWSYFFYHRSVSIHIKQLAPA